MPTATVGRICFRLQPPRMEDQHHHGENNRDNDKADKQIGKGT